MPDLHFTDDEQEALDLSKRLGLVLRRICQTDDSGWSEMQAALNQIQRAVLSQPICRAYADEFAPLG